MSAVFGYETHPEYTAARLEKTDISNEVIRMDFGLVMKTVPQI